MSKKNDTNKKVHALSKSDVDFYRMCIIFAIVCAFVMLVLRMSATMTARHESGANLTYNFYMLCKQPWFLIVSALAGAAAVAWFAYSRAKKVDERYRVFTSVDALALAVYTGVFFVTFGFKLNSNYHMFFLLVTVIAAGVFFVGKIYRRDFLFFTVMNGAFAVLIYTIASKVGALYIAAKLALLIAAVVVSLYFSSKNTTRTKSSKKNGRALLFTPVFVSIAIWAVCMFWQLVVNLTSKMYLSEPRMLVILLAQYLVAAIIYTIRLIRE